MFSAPPRSTQPTSIPGTKRQRITTHNGIELHRAYVSLKPETWEALRRMSIQHSRSNSQVIENLIQIASSIGTLKEHNGTKAI